jgi:uncharacterized protein YceK
MEKRYIAVILISVLFLCLTGCASIYSRGWEKGSLYPGTGEDLKEIRDSTSGGRSFAMYSLIDLPFSFVLDTVLLPFDAFSYFKEGRHKPVRKSTTEAVDINVSPPANATIKSAQ